MAYQHRSSREISHDSTDRIRRPFGRTFAIITALCVAVMTAAWAESETYDLSGFDGVSVAEDILVRVTMGSDFEVVAESDDTRQLELLELDVSHGTLRASMRNRPFSRELEDAPRVTIEVTMPSLFRVEASTGAEFLADMMSGPALEISSSTGAALSINELAGGTLSMGVTTGGSVRITGGGAVKRMRTSLSKDSVTAIYPAHSARHSVRAAARFCLKLSRE